MITGDKVVLRDKNMADARDDYTWKSDAELSRLDASPRLTVGFSQFLVDYAGQLRSPASGSRQFAIDTKDGKHIGNCGYYNVDEDRGEAEVGITIGDRNYWSRGYGTDAMKALVDYIFGETGLNRVYLKSLDWNIRAHRSFQKNGFVPCGRIIRDGYNFVFMEMRCEWWRRRQVETGEGAASKGRCDS